MERREVEQDGLLDALVQVAFAIMAVLNEIGGDNDLSLTQLRVLAILRDRKVGMTALAEHLGLEKSTITGLIARAEMRGLVVRSPSSMDGRAVDVRLARAGAVLARRLTAEVRQLLSPMTEGLTSSERRRLQDLLEQMVVGHKPVVRG